MRALTRTQQTVVDYLASCGHASDKAVAGMLWGNPRQYRRAVAIIRRLEVAGIVRLRPLQGNGERRSWELTANGR